MQVGYFRQPKERWVQSMTLLAQEVMPKLADLV